MRTNAIRIHRATSDATTRVAAGEIDADTRSSDDEATEAEIETQEPAKPAHALRDKIIAAVCLAVTAVLCVKAGLMIAASDSNWTGGIIPIAGLTFIAWRVWPRAEE